MQYDKTPPSPLYTPFDPIFAILYSNGQRTCQNSVVDSSQNQTSVHLAARFGLTGLMRYFVESSMAVNAKDKEGNTTHRWILRRELCAKDIVAEHPMLKMTMRSSP